MTKGVDKVFDWEKKLALKCGGTARILEIYVSDIVPCFVVDTYCMTYSKKENYYEFSPILRLTDDERKLIDKAKKLLKDSGFTFLSKRNASKKYKELCSDVNFDGNATLFSSLFSDTYVYQTETKRFCGKQLDDPTGKKISWTEYYDKNHKLKRREEYRYYSSKNVECVITDELDQIIEVKVWRDIEKETHIEFVLDILKEYKKKKRSKKS